MSITREYSKGSARRLPGFLLFANPPPVPCPRRLLDRPFATSWAEKPACLDELAEERVPGSHRAGGLAGPQVGLLDYPCLRRPGPAAHASGRRAACTRV